MLDLDRHYEPYQVSMFSMHICSQLQQQAQLTQFQVINELETKLLLRKQQQECGHT